MKEREYGLEDRMAGLFQPDTLLPSQYFDRVRRRGQYDGERRLMIAILEDAVDVYLKQAAAHDARGQQLFLEAEERCDDPDCTRLYAFEDVCDVLELQAASTR